MRFARFLQKAMIEHDYRRLPFPTKVIIRDEPKILIDPRTTYKEEEGSFYKSYLAIFNYYGKTESQLEQIDNSLKASIFKRIAPVLEEGLKGRWDLTVEDFMKDISGWTLFFDKVYYGTDIHKELEKKGLNIAIQQIYNLKAEDTYIVKVIPWPD